MFGDGYLEIMLIDFVFLGFWDGGEENFFSFINCVIMFGFLCLFLKLLCGIDGFFCGDFLLSFDVIEVWGEFWWLLLMSDFWMLVFFFWKVW